MYWGGWITSCWNELARGSKLQVPGHLPHPRWVGFHAIDVATPEGQCSDWGLSLTDGSRIHVHEYSDGRLVAHRDRFDPAAGFLNAVKHLLTETFVGPALLAVGVVVVLNRAARA